MRPPTGHRSEEGMVLLMVLLLVGVMSTIAVLVLDDVRFSTKRVRNVETASMAQWYAISAERLARRQIRRLHDANPQRTPIEPAWNGQSLTFPIDNGALRVSLADGQACFNLNSVVEDNASLLVAREIGVAQLSLLAQLAGISEPQAQTIANSVADWIDTDRSPRPFGGENQAYADLAQPRHPSGVMMVEVTEVRAVRGVDEAAYRALRPYLCALPTTQLSPININTLAPKDAPLLSMLGGGTIPLAAAQRAIASAPAAGWPNITAFWSQPALSGMTPPQSAQDQVTVQTRYFNFRADVSYLDGEAVRTGLFEIGRDNRIRTVISRWTVEE